MLLHYKGKVGMRLEGCSRAQWRGLVVWRGNFVTISKKVGQPLGLELLRWMAHRLGTVRAVQGVGISSRPVQCSVNLRTTSTRFL